MSVTAISQCSRFAENDYGIDLKDVHISVNGKDLLVAAHVQLNTGVHYGLLGRNGVGYVLRFLCADCVLEKVFFCHAWLMANCFHLS
jgi:ABC-type molybdenum transport system ATPase subunit/photorepair protein PhrA